MVVLYLLINGPGKWSIDALLDKLRNGKDTVISLDELLLSKRPTIVLQPTPGERGSPIRVR
jgi:hypothetical protein